MLKVAAGHYRDSYNRVTYDVRRAKYPLGTRTATGWEFVIPATKFCSQLFPSKDAASLKARMYIEQ